MSDPIFERYKEALKQGHVAVLRGRNKEALEHYRTAAEIADERPLPHTSLGGVLLRLGRTEEALASYARALGRAPRDEGALNGRAEALLVAGRQAEAAEILERLADVLASTGREPEALGTLRRALELSETKRRRRRYVELARALRIDLDEAKPRPGGAAASDTAEATAGEGVTPPAAPGGDDVPETAEPVAGAGAETAAPAVAGAAEAPAEPAQVVGAEGGIAEPPEAVAEGVAADAAGSVAVEPPDPEQLMSEAERARYEGRVPDALAGFVAAADAYLASGATDAALDACQRGLRTAPDSPSVHLMLARLYLARGWRDRAVEKLVLLDRLLELDGADDQRQALATLAAQHVAVEARFEPLARGPAVAGEAEAPATPPPA